MLAVDLSFILLYNDQILKISKSNEYKKYALQFLRLSKLNNDLLTVLQRNLKQIDKIENESWIIYIFAK